MGLIGFVAELVVLGACIAAVITNSLLLTACDLLDLDSVGINGPSGSLGLFKIDNPEVQGNECTDITKEIMATYKDGFFDTARVCGALAFCFGLVLLVFGFFKQCIIPLPCSQCFMDLSTLGVQVCLGLVYLIWGSKACDLYYCTYGNGATYLILTQIFWLGAGCFTRCMRPGRWERRDEIRAERGRKEEEKKRKAAEDELAKKEQELAEREAQLNEKA